jgi:stromal membrane-associated protein
MFLFFFIIQEMSTRHARVADKELNDKHTKILLELLQKPGNKQCADCRKKGALLWTYSFCRLVTMENINLKMNNLIKSQILGGPLGTWVFSFASVVQVYIDR